MALEIDSEDDNGSGYGGDFSAANHKGSNGVLAS